jgi:hypothetical protein
MKTSELSGAALDWAVAMIEGYTLNPATRSSAWIAYSTDWAQGGPIIEREEIAIFLEYPKEWGATDGNYSKGGDTPLVAAMRCYVASKMGDTIDIPKELTGEPA